jgi:hypothetical protein
MPATADRFEYEFESNGLVRGEYSSDRIIHVNDSAIDSIKKLLEADIVSAGKAWLEREILNHTDIEDATLYDFFITKICLFSSDEDQLEKNLEITVSMYTRDKQYGCRGTHKLPCVTFSIDLDLNLSTHTDFLRELDIKGSAIPDIEFHGLDQDLKVTGLFSIILL